MMINLIIAATLLLSSTGGAFAKGPSVQAKEKRSEERSTWVWSLSDDGVRTEARIEGKVVFADDYTDVLSVSEDGLFSVTDERGAESHKLRVMRGADGALQRLYYVNGRKQEFDADARAWLSKFLLTAVREGGLDAKARVRRLLKERGARGVLDEVSLLKNDYARRIYLNTLIEEGNLEGEMLGRALEQAARQLSSDYEKATFLIETADRYLASDELMRVFFAAIKTFGSDYEHHRVLSNVLRKQPDKRVLRPMLESAAAISSDYEKATFLIEAASFYMMDASLRAAFLQTVNSISSDYERGRVLAYVSKRMQPGSTLD